jgi:predicted NBD/HSP70 family sugar kinase
LARAAALIAELLDEIAGHDVADTPVMVGVGVPGPIEIARPSGSGALGGRVCAGTVLPSWAGYDPAAELAKRTGLPVLAENDANLGALGEQRFGVGRGVETLVFVKVSSGIGTGLILGGRLYRGSRGAAGEIGHVQVREDGALCRCGSRGCLETVSSADAALALLAPAHGRTMTAADLFALENAGDPGVLRLLADMGTAIGRVIAVIAANLDPNMVIVGGSMARSALVNGVAAAIKRFNQPYVAADMRVTAAALGERASLMGAIALAISAASGRSPFIGAASADEA